MASTTPTEIFPSGLMWFRRDLRMDDNTALREALQCCRKLWCVFVFDTTILEPLPRADRRVEFIHACVQELDAALRKACPEAGGGLIVCHGIAAEELPALAHDLGVQAVFAAHDYEPAAHARDAKVLGALADMGIALHTVKDQVILERRELLTGGGTPYTVFTPYKRAWLARVEEMAPQAQPLPKEWLRHLAPRPEALRQPVPALHEMGFKEGLLDRAHLPPGESGARHLFADFFDRMDDYHRTRDLPAIKGPSYLGVHLRFGTISIRRLVATAMQASLQGSEGAATWLSELCWRDFYFQILANFPHVAQGAFKPAYDAIAWEKGAHAKAVFTAWCEGRTGYPLVDAAMAQINQSGYMHNRLRMIAGSFLVKDLGIDWRWGEAYFAEKLNDFDLSANNGGWQWVASSGCDAQPWFRIFNPVTQSQRFDPEGKFIRRYLPQLSELPAALVHAPWQATPLELEAAGVHLGKNYPQPLVQHDAARELTLQRYAVVKDAGGTAPPKGARTPPARGRRRAPNSGQ